MKVIFAGTPEFAAHSLRAILAAGHEVVLVLTQPDRPAGRGLHMQISPVKALAVERGIPVLQPSSLKLNSSDLEKNTLGQTAFETIAQIQFDLMVVVAYGLLIPQTILDLTQTDGRFGCFNVHGSLLPRWRGAAPLQRAIQAGDSETGITIMRMDAGLDTGDQVAIEATPIAPNETSASLHDRLALMGAQLIGQCLAAIQKGQSLARIPQSGNGISYAPKILKSEGVINWHESAIKIDRQIRAFNPFPGASAQLNGEELKIWLSQIVRPNTQLQTIVAGTIFVGNQDEVLVACGEGVLELIQVQKSGGKKMSARAWFLGLVYKTELQFQTALS